MNTTLRTGYKQSVLYYTVYTIYLQCVDISTRWYKQMPFRANILKLMLYQSLKNTSTR